MAPSQTKSDFKVVQLSQASDLAKTISNKTAQTIVEHIGSKKKLTSSQIAKNLKLPASTVHYNLKALLRAGIVDDAQFTYSTKGKTIIHYTLTNNILVIVPSGHDEFSLLNSIKALVPSLIGVGVLGLAYSFFQTRTQSTLSVESAPVAAAYKSRAADTSQVEFEESFSSGDLSDSLQDFSDSAIQKSSSESFLGIPEFLWGVLISTVLIVSIFLVYSYMKKQRKN